MDIVTKAEIDAYRKSSALRMDKLRLIHTIEQFAEALRGECVCYFLRSWEGNHAMCSWCRRRSALLAQYDGATTPK